jgi:hypothetical protein
VATADRTSRTAQRCGHTLTRFPHIIRDNELPGHRIRFNATSFLFTAGSTTVPRGSCLPQLTVLPLSSSLQDQCERTRNPQARRPARHSQGLILTTQEPVRLRIRLLYYSEWCPDVPTPSESHDLTETTRAMTKRGSDDLKKLAALQATLVRCGPNVRSMSAWS